jgi:hypothetical protein
MHDTFSSPLNSAYYGGKVVDLHQNIERETYREKSLRQLEKGIY